MLFGTGLAMSLGHCVGMCGPIVGAFSIRQRERSGVRGLAPSLLLYHSGRVTSYVAIGAALGLIGSTSGIVSPAAHGIVTLGIAALMATVALGLLGVLPTGRLIEGHPLAGRIAARVRDLLGATTPLGKFGLGVANGFLPCGPVVAVALAAATADSPVLGGASLLLYGLGTLPALFLLGLGSGWVGGRARFWIHRFGATLFLLLSVQLALRGAAAAGLVPHGALGDVILW